MGVLPSAVKRRASIFWSSIIEQKRIRLSHHSSRKNHPIAVENYDELKKIVCQDIQQGVNQRDIVQKKFSINGEIIGLNPAKVKEIKEEFEKTDHANEEPNHVRLFKLFQKRYTQTAALIETGCTVDEVSKTHQQFLVFENKVDVPLDFMEKMYQLAIDTADDAEVSNEDTVIFYLSEAVKDALKYRKFTFPCGYCDLPIRVSGSSWPTIRKFLIKNGWHHKICP